MGEWARTTRGCNYEGLSAEMVEALNRHQEQYNLGPLTAQAVACTETTSKKVKEGLFERGDESVITGVVLAPGWLLWAIRAHSLEVAVMSARLADIVVQDYAATPFAKIVPDSGIEVSGSFTDVSERGSAFIGLDEGPAAQDFKQALIRAVQDAKK